MGAVGKQFTVKVMLQPNYCHTRRVFIFIFNPSWRPTASMMRSPRPAGSVATPFTLRRSVSGSSSRSL